MPTDRFDGYDPTAIPPPAPPPEVRAENLDGFRNELTGIGDPLRDKTLAFSVDVTLLSNYEAEQRWRGTDLGARLIEKVPRAMTRKGWDISIQPGEDDARADEGELPGAAPARRAGPLPDQDNTGATQAEALEAKLRELGASRAFYQALCYVRAYGGGAILIGADDGEQDLTRTLREDQIREVRHLTTFAGGFDGEIVAASYYSDPRSPRYGEPEIYQVRDLARPPSGGVPGAQVHAPGPATWYVHESRLLVFPGVMTSRWQRQQMRGWGDSIFTRIDRVLAQFDQTWGGVAILMSEFSVATLGIDGLAQLLGREAADPAAAAGTGVVTRRALALSMSQSIARVRIIDSKETYQRVTATVTGVPEILQQFAVRMSAAADMPVTVLFGQSASGLNATGEGDRINWYDEISAKQEEELGPQARRLVRLLMLANDSPTKGVEPAKWTFEFRPLLQLSDSELADVKLKTAQRDEIEIRSGVVTPEEVAVSRHGGAKWSATTVIDFDGRAAMAAIDERPDPPPPKEPPDPQVP